MAYSAGDTILDDEYNAFVANSSSPFGYNHFAGTGATVYGLGQTAIDTVSAGGVINASQWNALFTGITNIANHTNDTITSRSSVSAGDDIDIASAVAADLATLAASVAAGSPNATALATSSALQTQTSGSERQQHEILLQCRRQGQDHGGHSGRGDIRQGHSIRQPGYSTWQPRHSITGNHEIRIG